MNAKIRTTLNKNTRHIAEKLAAERCPELDPAKVKGLLELSASQADKLSGKTSALETWRIGDYAGRFLTVIALYKEDHNNDPWARELWDLSCQLSNEQSDVAEDIFEYLLAINYRELGLFAWAEIAVMLATLLCPKA